MYGMNNWFAQQQNMMLHQNMQQAAMIRNQERIQRNMLIQAEREREREIRQQERIYNNMVREAERQQREAERLVAQRQKEYMVQCQGNPQYQYGVSPTAKGIEEYICMLLGTTDVTRVDEFETQVARHICPGSNMISLIGKAIISVPTTKGIINAEYIFCNICKKLILNKSSILVV